MAKVRAIFQPVPGAVRHQKHVINLFPKLGVTEVWLSSAFVNSPGVSAIKEVLSSYKSVACCIVGVRNGASTVQGLTALLATGAKIYTVDTGTLSPIFHPKIYAVVSKSEASVIIGSANTTFAGLYNNIEASAHILLNLSDKSDAKFLAGITNSLKFIIKNYPLNCVQLIDIEQANQLLADGIVEDEECQKVLDPVGKSGKGAKSGSVPLMALPLKRLPRKSTPPAKATTVASTMAVVAEAPTTSNSSIHPVTYEKEVVFQHSVILINVGQSVAEKDSYEAVRYAWVLDKKRAEKTEYVLAVDHGLIIDVFIAERWLRATPDNFPRIAPDWPAWKVPRWGFVGRPAPTEIAEHYKHSWVPASMRKPGGRNPIRYANKSGPLA